VWRSTQVTLSRLHEDERLGNLGFETPTEFLETIAAAIVPPPVLGTDRAFNSDLDDLAAETLRRERGRLLLHRLLAERPSRWHQDRLQRVEALLKCGRR
jgi:hypothetical protein